MKAFLKALTMVLIVGILTQANLFAQGAKAEAALGTFDKQEFLFSSLEKGDFSTAKQLMTTGGYDVTVTATLTTVIDIVSGYYDNMTAENGLGTIKTLFTVIYPIIIGTGDKTDITIKTGTLNALTTAIYNKLKDNFYSEKDLQAKIYPMLQTIVMLPETYPGHKQSIYDTVEKLGFTGVTTSAGGVTEIVIPK
jgi:hypothetical protein